MNDNTTLLFVTGASRSGTTMLNRVLGTHDLILGMNELHYFGDIWNPTSIHPLNNEERIRLATWILARQSRGIWGKGPGVAELAQARVHVDGMSEAANGMEVYARVVRWMAEQKGKAIACEQTPRNIFYARLLLELDSDVKVIQMIRDPRAVVASQKNRWRRKKLGGANVPWREVIRVWFNYHPLTMAKLWREAAKAGDAMVEHPRFIQIRFEDLISKPEKIIPAICDFVGVKYQPSMLDVPMVGSSLRQDQSVSGFSKASLDSWKSVLSQAEIWIVERSTDDEMIRHQYARIASGPGIGVIGLVLRYPAHLLGAVLSNPRRFWIQVQTIWKSRA